MPHRSTFRIHDRIPAILTFAMLIVVPLAATPETIVLPASNVELKPSALPGYHLAQQQCGICHSADYVSQQPPAMTQAQWTAEVTKMKKAYGAPLPDDDIPVIAAYLASAYGVPGPAVASAPTQKTAAPPATAADAASLLAANGCLACHANDHKVFGPSYHDVAAKYRADPSAVATLVASLHAGSSGKWGPEGMPPFASLSDEDARTLAGYVLKQ